MLTFAHISDTHISSDPHYHPDWVDTSVKHPNDGVNDLKKAIHDLPFEIDFILHTGDVCADPKADNYHTARNLLQTFNIPIYMLVGNHDSARMMFDILPDGQNLHVLANDYRVVHDHYLIALDTNGIGDTHAPILPDSQIAWLQTQLMHTNNKPIIMATHHPLIATGIQWIDKRMRVQNGQRVHDVLIPYTHQIQGVFHGHIHQSVNSHCDGIFYTGTASTWYNLQAYPSLEVDEHDRTMQGGFNLVMIRNNRTYIRRYTL